MDKEKKTIGRFISILRRANGMTQQELGDKLFVSDKTVSRWERDESTPDLSLIPEIADIFGVTVDELLRGERRIESARESATDTGVRMECSSSASRKSWKKMLRRKSVWFRNHCLISIMISFAGCLLSWAISTLSADWIRDRDTLGLILVLISIGTSLTLLLCSASKAFGDIDTILERRVISKDEYTPSQTEDLRKQHNQNVTGVAVVFYGNLLALVCALPLDIPQLLYYFLLPLSLGGVLFVVHDLIVERILIQKGVLIYPDALTAKKRKGKNERTKVICTLLSCLLLSGSAIFIVEELLHPILKSMRIKNVTVTVAYICIVTALIICSLIYSLNYVQYRRKERGTR